MTDRELIDAAKDRCLKRRLYDFANKCTMCDYKLKKYGQLLEHDRRMLWAFIKMQPKGADRLVRMGEGRYYKRGEDE